MEALAIAFVLNSKEQQIRTLSPEMVLEKEALQNDITLLQEQYVEALENY